LASLSGFDRLVFRGTLRRLSLKRGWPPTSHLQGFCGFAELGVPDGLIVRFASQHKSKLHVDFCLSELSFGFSRRKRVKPVEYSWLSMRVLSLKEMGKGAFLPPSPEAPTFGHRHFAKHEHWSKAFARSKGPPPNRTLFVVFKLKRGLEMTGVFSPIILI
jgi:hypothetical protein